MMIKLNSIHYPIVEDINISKEYSLDILKNNELYLDIEKKFLKKYSFSDLKTFSFNKDGFLALLFSLQQKGKIAISVGETNALVEAGKFFEDLGFEISWINLKKNGQVDFDEIINLDVDFMFLSSYVMDTFVKTDLEKVKNSASITLISNGTVECSKFSDAVYFDPYKLLGSNMSGVILSDGFFEKQPIGYIDNIAVYLLFNALEKQNFVVTLQKKFKKNLEEKFGEDIYFFVDSNITLDFTLHFGLRNLRARELIRTVSLDEILITNGEGCSLGLSLPSRVIQEMGYSQDMSRNSISLSFGQEIDDENIEKVCAIFYKRYRQIKVLG